jgi:LPS export ABC transporter protein LptC
MESYRRPLIVCLLLVGVGIVWWNWGSSPSTGNGSDTSTSKNGIIEQQVSEFSLVETTGPGEVWTLKAPSSTRSGETTTLRSPYVTLREKGDTTAVITAEQGLYNMTEQRLTLRGNVRINRTLQRQVLMTEVLNWDQSKGTIETDHPVKITSPGRTLRAVGIWADLSEERVQFQSNVSVLSR